MTGSVPPGMTLAETIAYCRDQIRGATPRMTPEQRVKAASLMEQIEHHYAELRLLAAIWHVTDDQLDDGST